MMNYREILRLNSLNYSGYQIVASVYSSRNTIREVLRIANTLGMKWPLDDTVTNEALRGIFNPERSVAVNPRKGTRL